MPTDVTQTGGSSSTMSEGPLRSGLIPKKITFPFKKPPFYSDQLRNVSRCKLPEMKSKPSIIVRQKRMIPAGGNGVFTSFSRGR